MLRHRQLNAFAWVRYMASYQTNHGYRKLRCIKNYYDVLKVPVNCDKSDIKRAYIELSKKYHPDGSSQTSDSEEFIKVCEAYKILSKRVSRESYNNRLRSQFYMVPPVDISYMNQNIHKSWKKYQAAMRNKQFGHNIPSFHGSSIVHKKPKVIKSKSMNSMLSVIPSINAGDDSDDKRSLRKTYPFKGSGKSSKLFTYYITGFSIVGVLLATEFFKKHMCHSTGPSL
ncbi:chaperone protein DnaJ [Drosophila innubila]|uniref:chaperone protein DnaJ n=1 Tax=Drosophila innubila TaxID=198719 RepID=UPI00148B8046|nr:chaperone protein DnaJ [Drosophila innubila]